MKESNIEECIEILKDGIQKHQLPLEDLPELIEILGRNEDFVSEELGFELIAGQLRVSLHDRVAWCDPGSFLVAIHSMYVRGEFR